MIKVRYFHLDREQFTANISVLTYFFDCSPAMRLELAGVFLGAFYSIFAAQSSVRVFCGLLWYNHYDSPLFLAQVTHIVFNDARFEVRISRAHSKQNYTVVRHHFLACLENETVFNLSKIENHFDWKSFVRSESS